MLIQRFFDMNNKEQDIDVIKLNHLNAKELKEMELKHQEKLIEGQIGVAREQREAAIGAAKERVKEAEAEERAKGRKRMRPCTSPASIMIGQPT